jgi:hypothetical protein
MEVWFDHEFTGNAIAKDGSVHPSTNVLTGLITAGDHYNLAFELPPEQIARFEISVRPLDQFVEFGNVRLNGGHPNPPNAKPASRTDKSHWDQAFYDQLFMRDFGVNIQAGHLEAAIDAANKLESEIKLRRQHLKAADNSDFHYAEMALPIVEQVQAALKDADLTKGSALLQAGTKTGRQLQDALQQLAQDP